MKKTATLAGVAQHAGVSTATVARVLKNEGYVSEETRLRVEAAVKETNYRTNAFARGLRTNRSLMIANLLQATTRNPIFAEIARGVEEEALRNGYTVILLNMEGNPERERVGVERMIERRVDAMIFTHALGMPALSRHGHGCRNSGSCRSSACSTARHPRFPSITTRAVSMPSGTLRNSVIGASDSSGKILPSTDRPGRRSGPSSRNGSRVTSRVCGLRGLALIRN